MSYAFVTEFPIEGSDRSTTNYDAINDKLVHVQALVADRSGRLRVGRVGR